MEGIYGSLELHHSIKRRVQELDYSNRFNITKKWFNRCSKVRNTTKGEEIILMIKRKQHKKSGSCYISGIVMPFEVVPYVLAK